MTKALITWDACLVFDVQKKNQLRIDALFERCLFANWNEEYFWVLYGKILEERMAKQSPVIKAVTASKLRDVYRRACTVHLPNSLLSKWTEFRMKKTNRANLVLNLLERVSDDYGDCANRRAKLHQSQGEESEALACL